MVAVDKPCDTIKVAIRIRPLIKKEVINQDTNVIKYPFPGEPQLRVGEKEFRFDYVFNEISKQTEVYEQAVKPLVDSFLKGYNTTIFAYGQTGSGKTYTMGTHGSDDLRLQEEWGIIPASIKDICEQLAKMEHHTSLMTSFIEIYKENVRDLLDSSHTREKVTIVEEENGGIGLRGCERVEVKCYDDLMEIVDQGSSRRQTGETSMNNQSSRSHAIFTIYLQQVKEEDEQSEDGEKKTQAAEGKVVTSKFHFVDLAGSERAKLTKAEGDRFKEGIAINSGLLALGNVIACLSRTVKAKHVPFRDSKLTRILQDSLGGNSLTIMIACLSPAGSNIGQSVNTLNYANRAKMIKNKPVVNVDARSKEIGALRDKIKVLEAKLRGGEGGYNSKLDNSMYSEGLTSETTRLMLENAKLRGQVEVAEESLKDSQAKLKKLRHDLSDKQDLMYENLAKSREAEMRYAKMLLKLQSLDSSIDSEEFELTDQETKKARKLVDFERENMEMRAKVKELEKTVATDQFALEHLQKLTGMAERFNEGKIDAFDQELSLSPNRSPLEKDSISMDALEFKDESKEVEEDTVALAAGEADDSKCIEVNCDISERDSHDLLESLETEVSKSKESFVNAKKDLERREKNNKIKNEVIGRDISRTNRQIKRLQEIMRMVSRKQQTTVLVSQQSEMKMKQLEMDLKLAEESRRKLELKMTNTGCSPNNSIKLKLEQANARIKRLKEALKKAKRDIKAEKKALEKELRNTRHLNRLREEMAMLKCKKVNLQKQLKADNKSHAMWRTQHQQLVKQLNKKVRQKSISVKQTKLKIENIKRTLKEKTEKNASLTRQLRQVRKEKLRRTTKSAPHLKRRIQALTRKLRNRDKIVRRMRVLMNEIRTLQSEISIAKKESGRVRLTLQGWMGVPEKDRDNTEIQRLEQDQLRVNDQIGEIEAQILQNKNALVVHEKNLNKVTKPNSYRKILKNLEFLQRETQESELLAKKIVGVTKCTEGDMNDIGAALPDDGVRVAVILTNMLLSVFRDKDASEKRREETDAEMLDLMSENQRLSRDRKNWENMYRAVILAKSAMEVERHNSQTEENNIISEKCKGDLDNTPSREDFDSEVVSFPEEISFLNDSTTKFLSSPELSKANSLNQQPALHPPIVPGSNLLTSSPGLTGSVNEVLESPMDICVSREINGTPDKENISRKLTLSPEKRSEKYRHVSSSNKTSPVKDSEFTCSDEKHKQSSSPVSLDTSFGNCFDRLASPSGWTGTHKVTAFELQINKAHVRVKKKLEKKKWKKRKAAKKTMNVLKRHRGRCHKDFHEMTSPSKKTCRLRDSEKKARTGDLWSRLHSTKIGHAKHSQHEQDSK